MTGESQEKLIDPYNRRLNYLRISITDRCNLNCSYCDPGRLSPKLRHEEILNYEEILKITRTFISLGVSKIRVTGGEPLVRKGVYDFLSKIQSIDGIQDLSLTTNGVLLRDNLAKIKSAGVKRLNISLDTLNPEKYKKITGMDAFHKVWNGIMAAHESGFSPIKINAVAMAGVNQTEIEDLAALSFSYPFHIRFIEQMPLKGVAAAAPLLSEEIKRRVGSLGTLVPVKKTTNGGPARMFKLKGAMGEVGFISPISDHFCRTCNRLRLTAKGSLRICLLSDVERDLKGPLRSGCSSRELCSLILDAIRFKPLDHGIKPGLPGGINSRMSSIGG